MARDPNHKAFRALGIGCDGAPAGATLGRARVISVSYVTNPDDLIAQIYEAALDPGLWPKALDGLAGTFRARAVMLSSQDTSSWAFSAVAPHLDSSDLRRYARDWAAHNLLRRATAHAEPGIVFTPEMALPHDEYAQSDFYNGFMRPLGLETTMGTNLVAAEATVVALSAHRRLGAGQFDASERRLFAYLAPHVGRAVRIRMRLSRLELLGDSLAATIQRLCQAVLLLDAAGKVTFANHAAEALLVEPGGIRETVEGLAASRPCETAMLRRLLARCADRPRLQDGCVRVSRGDGRCPLLLHVFAIDGATSWSCQSPPAAIVFITDPDRDQTAACRALQQAFGLTPAETALAGEIVKGHGLSEAARRRGIALNTARTHLARVFDKTGARHQSELTRIVLELRGGPQRKDSI